MPDIENYTPEQLANASTADLESLLDDMNVDDNKQKYFSAFDSGEIEDILKIFENKLGQLSLSSKTKVAGLKSKLSESKEAERQFSSKSGFASAGNPLMMQQKGLSDSINTQSDSMGLQQAGLTLDKDRATKSAYEEYETKLT